MDNYKPPFDITNLMLSYISSIMENIGKLTNYNNLNKMPILRRNTRIQSIHSSLAIEANSLTFNQVKDVINGKIVLGPQKEIHGIMTYLTVEESGTFRKGNEGVFDNDVCIHIAPKPELVENLMQKLFDWAKQNKDNIHPLILSSVFHYEFVFIHPFSDGNGRTIRLWQNILLYKWKNIFEYVPIESQLKKYQEDYYKAIDNCNKKGNSTEFIEFMLKMINEILIELLNTAEKEVKLINNYVSKLLNVMDYNIPMSTNELMQKLNLKSKKSFKNTYLNPAIENNLISMTIPDKPTSKNQRYYKN